MEARDATQKKTLVLLGDSLTEFCGWDGLKADYDVVNHGVAGDTTMGLWTRVNRATRLSPWAVILQIGINDLGQGLTPEELADNHARIWRDIRANSPQSVLVVCSLLPIREEKLGWTSSWLANKRVKAVNKLLRDLAAAAKLPFLDLFSVIADEQGELPERMTLDGVHLTDSAYQVWTAELRRFLLDF